MSRKSWSCLDGHKAVDDVKRQLRAAGNFSTRMSFWENATNVVLKPGEFEPGPTVAQLRTAIGGFFRDNTARSQQGAVATWGSLPTVRNKFALFTDTVQRPHSLDDRITEDDYVEKINEDCCICGEPVDLALSAAGYGIQQWQKARSCHTESGKPKIFSVGGATRAKDDYSNDRSGVAHALCNHMVGELAPEEVIKIFTPIITHLRKSVPQKDQLDGQFDAAAHAAMYRGPRIPLRSCYDENWTGMGGGLIKYTGGLKR
jgi:hypothetical protein